MIGNISLAFILLTFILLFKTLYKSFWNPLSIFSMVWFFSVLGTIVGPIQYTPISIKMVIFITASFSAIFLGALTPALLRMISKARIQGIKCTTIVNNQHIFLIIVILSLLGTLGPILMLLHLYRGAYLSLLLNPALHSKLREMSLSGGEIIYSLTSSLLLSLNIVALVFAGLLLATLNKIKKYIFLWPLVNILIGCLITTGRSTIIWGLMLFISSFVFSKIFLKRQSIKLSLRHVVLLFIIIVILASMRNWRGGNVKDTYLYTKSFYGDTLRWKIDSPSFYSLLSVFDTFSGSIPALSQFLETSDFELGLGVYTFKPFFKWLGSKDISFYYHPAHIPFEYNVFSYLRELYVDFGFLGMVCFNMILGFFASFYYYKCKDKISLINLTAVSFITTFLLYSIWLPISYATMFWSSLAISIIISMLIPQKFYLEKLSTAQYGQRNS